MGLSLGGALKGAAIIGTGGLAAPFFSGQEADKNQAKATSQTLNIERERNQLERERFNFARDQARKQWTIYRDQILPIELQAADLGIEARELALQQGKQQAQLFEQYYRPITQQVSRQAQAGVADRTGRVVSEAAGDVSTQFQRQREIEERNLSRFGVRPDSGRFRGAKGTLGLAEAEARVAAVNTARDRERTRQETTNFNRQISAANLSRPSGALPSQGASISGNRSPSLSSASLTSTASQAAATQYGQQASAAYGIYGDLAGLGIKAYSAGIFS